MISIELNNIFRDSVQYAKAHKHEYLTLEHIFLTILKSTTGSEILKAAGADVSEMVDLISEYVQTSNPVMETLEEGKDHNPYETVTLSNVMNDMVSHINASGKPEAQIGDLLASMFTQEDSYAYTVLVHEGVSRLDILEVISHTSTADDVSVDEEGEKNPNLKAYTTELVEVAKSGKIDPIIGRSEEIDRVMQTLCRRKKNNPLLVGEPGVGKTAIAEGLALLISEDKVPEVLKDSSIFALDLGAMISGTKYRGDFEAFKRCFNRNSNG